MLRRVILVSIFLLFTLLSQSQNWKAAWISPAGLENKPNTWLAYRKKITLTRLPAKAIARIAADTKYWLWINGSPILAEGGLKRGPDPSDTYYDEVNIAPWLKAGDNTVEVMVWYFGKDGFSHKSSGKAGLLFDCQTPGLSLLSDSTWQCRVLESYGTAAPPLPNYRLAESSLLYDARKKDARWRTDRTVPMEYAAEAGPAGTPPWRRLILRPIPLFKDFGLKKYAGSNIHSSATSDTIICRLPYNAQVTPYLKIDAPEEGQLITICTDNYLYYNGGAGNIRSEYLTSKGVQEYESPGWINGHKVFYIVPKGIRVLALQFRESGYNTSFAGSFSCSDPFFNRLWKKARRTLYLTMRDNYMDCPDRERAQWTGDAVTESGESYYALSPSSHALAKKWLLEIAGWQRPDSILYAPVPAGNWDKELPGQSLATIGRYGLWNYYLHTGDRQTLATCYEAAKKYLYCWKPDGKGTVRFREGGWAWGDWGDNKDIELIDEGFYYLALDGMLAAATELHRTEDSSICASFMHTFRESFNRQFWTGKGYRHPGYHGRTDDRVQALAILAGLADREKYPALLQVFQEEEHASPYLEKYVDEALFRMGESDYALERLKKRFGAMVNDDSCTTLWEGWTINDPRYGGGTVNHAWSGGGLTLLSQYVCGVAPIAAGYNVFQILPHPGHIRSASVTVSTVAGKIRSAFEQGKDRFTLTAEVPPGTTAFLGIPGIPVSYTTIRLNGKIIRRRPDEGQSPFLIPVKAGKWTLVATGKITH